MVSLHRLFLPEHFSGFQATPIPDHNRRQIQHLLSLAKLIATNAKQSAQALQKGSLRLFDPIVHDNACQIRALRAILSLKELQEEAKALQAQAVKIEQAINKHMSNSLFITKDLTMDEFLKQHQLEILTSQPMAELLQAHFLTIAKEFHVRREDGQETATISPNTLRNKLKLSNLNLETLQEIIEHCQKELSLASTSFIQEEGEKVGLKDELQMTEKVSNRLCTRAFYNLKAVLMRLHQENIPIFVRQHDGKIGTLFSQGQQTSSLPSRESPILVIEGFGDEKALPLMEMALANVAAVAQFSTEDRQGVTEEIEQHRKVSSDIMNIFKIVHIRAGLAREEL